MLCMIIFPSIYTPKLSSKYLWTEKMSGEKGFNFINCPMNITEAKNNRV